MFGRKPPSDEAWESSRKRLQALEDDMLATMRRVRELQDELELLRDKHVRLRGLIYAKKMHKPDPEETGDAAGNGKLPPNLSREELRRQMTQSGRFMPGRPPVHNE